MRLVFAINEIINKFVRDVIDIILGAPGYTIRGNQKDAPRPIGSYADVILFSTAPVGYEETKFENNIDGINLDETISGLRALTFSIGFYRDDAIDNADKIQMGLIRESIQSLFLAANIGFISRTQVRHIPESLENGWEERAQFDLELSVVGTDQAVSKLILSTIIESEYQSRGLKYNSNIEV